MGYCFVHTEKVKGMNSLTKIYRHNYRLDECLNVNPDLSKLNKELISLNGKEPSEVFKEKITELQAKGTMKTMRKDAVHALDIVLSFSREDNEKVNVDQWAKTNVEWLKEHFNINGENNVISAMLHLDEAGCPHIHAMVIPIKDGRLSAFAFTNGPKALKEMQDSYANAMKPFGLKRGLEKSVAKHEDIKKFYTSLNQVSYEKLPPPLQGESLDEYHERASKIYINERTKAFKKQKDMERKITEAKTQNLQKELSLEAEKRKHKKKIKRLEQFCGKISDESIENGYALEKTLNDLKTFRDLKFALKNHPDIEKREQLENDLLDFIKWTKRNREKNNEKWKDILDR